LVWVGLSAAALGAGCGGSGGTGQFGGGPEAGSGSGGSSGAGSSGDDGGGDDSTTSSGSGSGTIIDASLDIGFPDVFGFPDTGGGSGGGSGSSSGGQPTCAPNGITCAGNVANICNAGMPSMQTCAGATPTCANGYGCVACVPGTGSCAGNVGTACNATGTGTVTSTCNAALGEACDGATGQCTGDCANLGTSYIGCEYYAVTMSNSAIDQTTFKFSVSLSNTSTQTANITIVGPNATNVTDTIAAGQLKEYYLGWVQPISCSGTCNGLTNDTPGTELVASGAYHIESNEPLSVYQFNARDYVIGSEYSYTNDASLLIPVNAQTGNYRVVAGATWEFSSTGHQYPGNVAIIGTTAGTQVTYTAPAGNPIQAGGGLSTTGGTVTLNAGDVLQIAAAGNASASAFGSDQTGALISATQPVEVFGGCDCTYMAATVPACDHIEQINLPLETLGSDYLVTLPNNQNGAPKQYVKMVGTVAGTTLSYDPGIAGAPATLAAGQVAFFQTTQHFHVTSTQPVMIGQFMESENNFTTSDTAGDPAESISVATAQFRNSYQFVAPANYAQNWVNVIAPAGATVTLDGAAVGGFAAIGSSGYSVAYVQLCANNASGCTGVHNASSTTPFGIEVYGYGSYTSYMYPGGLNLNRL
jgi:hypothetical protein